MQRIDDFQDTKLSQIVMFLLETLPLKKCGWEGKITCSKLTNVRTFAQYANFSECFLSWPLRQRCTFFELFSLQHVNHEFATSHIIHLTRAKSPFLPRNGLSTQREKKGRNWSSRQRLILPPACGCFQDCVLETESALQAGSDKV